jgi:hypothetical protein
MSEEQDRSIAELLSKAAPLARDPVFRLRVLELRERRQFQRRLYIMLAGSIAMISVSILAITLGGGALETTGAPVIGVAVASACLAFRHNLTRILRHFRI